MKKLILLGSVAAVLSAAAPLAQAEIIFGLTSANNLVRFDSAAPGAVTLVGLITQPGIVDIDFFPVNGLLYAITGSGATYTVNILTGAATLAVSPLAAFDGTVTDMDFNPSADRMRIYTNGTTTENYRMIPDANTGSPGTPGTVVPDGTFSDAAAVLVSSAYTNNADGAASTILYSINTTSDRLVTHTGTPQFNTIADVGTGLGVAVGSNVGFDVSQSGVAFMSNDTAFFTVNLTTGVATAAGTVGAAGTGLVSIAAQSVPEPTTASLALLGVVGLLARRRRTA